MAELKHGFSRFSALHSHSVSHSILLPSNLVFRLMSYVFFSILLSSLFGIAPKSKTKRSSAWKTIDPLYFYTLKLKKLIPSSLRQFGLQTPFNFYGCFKSRVPDPVFRSASLLRTTFYAQRIKKCFQFSKTMFRSASPFGGG